jgi:hypothetical protein
MEVIAQVLKQPHDYSQLKQVYTSWDTHCKSQLFLDLAIVHRSTVAIGLVADIEGPEIFQQPYDDHDRITPIYVAQLLGTLNDDYDEITEYMLKRISQMVAWNRRRGLLWLLRQKKQPWMQKLSGSLTRHLVEEFL